jgi:hypothetical protein
VRPGRGTIRGRAAVQANMTTRTTGLLCRVAVIVLATAAIVLAMPAGPAAAAVRAIAVDPTTGPPLTTIKVTGSGFCAAPCGPVSISVGSLYVSSGVTVASDGTFTTFIRIPGTARPGPVDVIATQTGSDGGSGEARSTFTVTINQPAPKSYPPPSTVPAPGGLPGAATPAASQNTGGAPPNSPAASTNAPPAKGNDNPAAPATRPTSGSFGPVGWSLAVLLIIGLAAAGWWGWRRRGRQDRAEVPD